MKRKGKVYCCANSLSDKEKYRCSHWQFRYEGHRQQLIPNSQELTFICLIAPPTLYPKCLTFSLYVKYFEAFIFNKTL